MYDKLCVYFYSLQSTFYSYQRLAESRHNPYRMGDFTRACIIAGRMEGIARIVCKEWDDTLLLNDVSDIVRWCEETAEALR